jgi:hypothetical protein
MRDRPSMAKLLRELAKLHSRDISMAWARMVVRPLAVYLSA